MSDESELDFSPLRALDAALPPEANAADEALWRRAVAVERARRARRSALVAAVAVAACASLVWRSSHRTAPVERAPEAVARVSPPRSLVAEGTGLVRQRADAVAFEADARAVLSGGSVVTASRDGRGAITLGADGVTRVALTAGEVTVDAAPTAARRLVVEHGAYGAWVHGTRFTVRAVGEAIEVRVREGDVLVRGPSVPDGVHARGGEVASVASDGRLVVTAQAAAATPVAGDAGARRSDPVAAGAGEAAEEARLREASLALAAHDPARALAGFGAYLARRPRGPMAEDALAGVMDARVQMGDRPGAERAARLYLQRFANGVAKERAEQVLSIER